MGEEWEGIRKALENPQYKWRTVEGIAKETGYDFSTVIDKQSPTPLIRVRGLEIIVGTEVS
jgi:hypothetical protein